MASAKKCDRCGRYYDRTNHEGIYHVTIRGVKTVDDDKKTVNHKFDLCDVCGQELDGWLNRFKEATNETV